MECLLSSAKTIRMIRSRMDDMAVARTACMTHGRKKGMVYAEMGCLHDSASCRLGCLIYHHRVENATSSKRGRGCCRVLWESRDYVLIAQTKPLSLSYSRVTADMLASVGAPGTGV